MERETERLYLMPGQLWVGKQRTEITTILGSCVAVCIWDKDLKLGGMNHFLLPMWTMSDLQSPKFGNIAIEKIVEQMYSLGSKKYSIVAKVFGGARLFGYDNSLNVGQKNIDMALTMLENFQINIAAQSTGGNQGRKIVFDTYTGVVQMKYIQNTMNKQE